MSMKESSKMLLAAVLFFGLATLATIFGGCGGGDDDTTCMAVENCPDAGMMTADADPTAPDADTTPDANGDVCADYAGVPSDGWQCYSTGNPPSAMNGLTFIVEDGACRLRSDSFWCQDPPPATDVQAGQFSCTAISDAFVTCWHN